MKFNLKQVFDIVGESKDIEYSINPEQLTDARDLMFSSPVEVSGKVFNRAGVVTLKYSVVFSLFVTCDRCLRESIRDYSFDFEHIVVPSLSSENDDYIVAEGESIEMNDIAVTDLILQLPTKNLCKEDCKGLCMVCGCDLNEKSCNCLNY